MATLAQRSRYRRLRALLALALLLGAPEALRGRAAALPATLGEYQVKAALLFNIAKYVNWPEHVFDKPGAPIVVGVLGDDPFGEVLDELVKGRTINGHPIVIRRADGITKLEGVHLVFVSPGEPNVAQDCALLEKYHVLTVGDTVQTSPFTAFNLAVQGEKIVFSVDLMRTQRAGVTVSSKLLQYATTVKKADPDT